MAEVAFLARSLHWSLPHLLDLEHADRRHFIELVGAQEADVNDTLTVGER